MVERDFAFTMNNDITAAAVLRAVGSTNKDLIKNIAIFDLYSGNKIEDGKKSIAISVQIQSNEKTLTDDEIEAVCNNIISNVQVATGAILRR